jgi:hypothetical protein
MDTTSAGRALEHAGLLHELVMAVVGMIAGDVPVMLVYETRWKEREKRRESLDFLFHSTNMPFGYNCLAFYQAHATHTTRWHTGPTLTRSLPWRRRIGKVVETLRVTKTHRRQALHCP